MTEIIDLSIPIRDDHFRWTDTERKLLKSHDKGAGQGSWIGLSCHAFTHMDAPVHYWPGGHSTDDLTLDKVVGEGAVVDISDVAGPKHAITAADLAAAGAHIREGDIVLLKTRWDERYPYTVPEFWGESPWVTAEAAEWLGKRGIRACGFDFPQDYSIRNFLTGEPAPAREDNPTHYHLLQKRDVILIEYLGNMGALKNDRTFVIALPLKIPNCDGAPSRVICLQDTPTTH
ncbi:MAG: cyclase family protein [Acetobacterales bacterium]